MRPEHEEFDSGALFEEKKEKNGHVSETISNQ
jgi:hypothetical protein